MKRLFAIALMFSLCSQALASEIRQPQGRLGLRYKTEAYRPLQYTNITKKELEKIGTIIKEEENKQKQNEKEIQKAKINHLKKEKELKEQARRDAIAKRQAEEKAQKEAEKLALKKQKEEELSAKKAEEAQLKAEKERELEATRLAKEAEKQKLQEEKLALQKEKEALKEAKEAERLEAKKQKEAEKLALQEEKVVEENETIERKESFFTKLSGKIKKEEVAQEAENKVEPMQPDTTSPVQKDPIKAAVASKPKHKDYETQKIIEEVTNELSTDRPQMLEELSALWVSAVQKSDTVYFAIMKLSNPNGEAVNKTGVKKILQPILNAAPLVGQAFVNPALTAGSLIGSNVLGTMMNDSATKRLTKVNDADLVILARAIDELQETLLSNYMAYKSAMKEYELAVKIADARKKDYDTLNSQNSPHLVLANTFYTEALDNQYKARQEFLMKRVVLEQMVGADAINEIEKKTTGITALK